MGCSASKLEEEETVQLCKDRKNFIKQVIENRNSLAIGHLTYIQSMRRVSFALLHSVEAGDLHEFLSDSCTTPPFTPVKWLSPELRSVPLKSLTPTPVKMVKNDERRVNYLRSGGNQSVSVEEWPEPHETVHFESYYPMENYSMDGSFSSPYNRSGHEALVPQASRWDYFWNPFSSLDSYGYLSRSSFDRIVSEDDVTGLRQVREAEGIPELEEDIDDSDDDDDDDDDDDNEDDKNIDDNDHHHQHRRGSMCWKPEVKNKTPEIECKHTGVQVGEQSPVHVNGETRKVQEVKEFKSKGSERTEASKIQNGEVLEISNQAGVAGIINAEQTPGFTVHVNRRHASMADVMKEMDIQFIRICDCAHEISIMLEASRAQYSSAFNEVRMLNPVALFRSSSRSSSLSKFFKSSSGSRGDADESSSNYSEECCMLSGSHKSTLDKLYAWEKKLYEEVKSGERARIAYEKKCIQLRNHDINGDEPAAVDKTRAAIRDLHTRLTISIHTVESISKRIELVRDGELHPQLMEIIHGLSRMWKTMADCHSIQKRTMDEAKLLLFSASASTSSSPQKTPIIAAYLAAELRNWRCSFANWVDAQRAYTRAIASWASRLAPSNASDTPGSRKALSPLSPLRGCSEGNFAAPEVVQLCAQWSRLVDSVSEDQVVDGMDFFAAGIASVSAQQRESVEGERASTAEAAADVGSRVLCAGLSVAVGSLAEFAVAFSEGYHSLVRSGGGGEDEKV